MTRTGLATPAIGVALAVMMLVAVSPAASRARENGLIAYAVGGGEEPGVIRAVEPDGSGDRRLIGPRRERFRLGASAPEWSADGRRLLFGGHHRFDRPAQSLWYSTAAGTRVRRIRLGLGGGLRGPEAVTLHGWDWAPGARRVVFAAARGAADPTLYTIRIDGTHRRSLRRGQWPEWSADGRHIVFTSRSELSPPPELARRDEIAVMRRDGGGFRRLTGSSHDSHPSVSPDGRTVLFLRSFEPVPFDDHPERWRYEWRLVDISGRRERLVTTHRPWSEATQAPTGVRYGPPRWTPDGRRIAAMRSQLGATQGPSPTTLVTMRASGGAERVQLTFPGPGVWWSTHFSWQPR